MTYFWMRSRSLVRGLFLPYSVLIPTDLATPPMTREALSPNGPSVTRGTLGFAQAGFPSEKPMPSPIARIMSSMLVRVLAKMRNFSPRKSPMTKGSAIQSVPGTGLSRKSTIGRIGARPSENLRSISKMVPRRKPSASTEIFTKSKTAPSMSSRIWRKSGWSARASCASVAVPAAAAAFAWSKTACVT